MQIFLYMAFLLYSYFVLSTLAAVVNTQTDGQSSTKITDKTITDDTLKKLLDKLSEVLGPSQVLPDETIFWKYQKLCINASSLNTTMENPSSFSITATHVNMTTLEFFVGISYETLSMFGQYNLVADYEGFAHLEGADNFSIDMSDLSTTLYLKLNLTANQTLDMEEFILDYNTTMKVDFKNLGGSQKVSDTLNKYINYLLPETITSTKGWVVPEVKQVAFERGKFIFTGMTVDQLISNINSLVDS